MSQVALRCRVEYAVPRQGQKRCCIFLLGPGGLKGPAHPLLRVLGGGVGRDGRQAGLGTCCLIFLFQEETSLSWKEDACPACQRASWRHLSEVLCLGLVFTAEAQGLGPGLEQAAVARGGGGQPPPRPRGRSLPLPDVLIWATGSAFSGEPRGQVPARLRKVQQEQESEAEEEEASANTGALRADRPDQGA